MYSCFSLEKKLVKFSHPPSVWPQMAHLFMSLLTYFPFNPVIMSFMLFKRYILHSTVKISIPEKLVALSYVKKCRELYHINLIIRKKVSVLYIPVQLMLRPYANLYIVIYHTFHTYFTTCR